MLGGGDGADRGVAPRPAGDGDGGNCSRNRPEMPLSGPFPGENALVPVCGAVAFSTAGPLWTRPTGGGFCAGLRP